MLRLIYSDVFRSFRRISTLIICIIILLLALSNTLVYSNNRNSYKSLAQSLAELSEATIDSNTRESYYDQIWWAGYVSALNMNSTFFIILVLISLGLGGDFSSGRIDEMIYIGNSRGKVFIAKLVSTYLLCIFIPLLGVLVNFFSYPPLWWGHFSLIDFKYILRPLVYVIPESCFIIAACIAAAFISKKPVPALLLGFLLAFSLHRAYGFLFETILDTDGKTILPLHLYLSLYPSSISLESLQITQEVSYKYFNVIRFIQLLLVPILISISWFVFKNADLKRGK